MILELPVKNMQWRRRKRTITMKPKDKITALTTTSEALTQPPKLIGVEGNDDAVNINGKDQDKLFKAIGTCDPELMTHFFRQLDSVSAFKDQNRVSHINTALAILHGIKPRDELEAMLVTQMIGVHNLALSFMGKAVIPEQNFDAVEGCINWSTKLLRTFTAQVETLTRYRGGGQQKVTVEHVHVNEGGQAIVGNVGVGVGVKHDNHK